MKSILSVLSTLFSDVRALQFRWFKGRFLANEFTIKNPINSVENWFSNASMASLWPKVMILGETQFWSRYSSKANIKDNDLPPNSESLHAEFLVICLFARSDWIPIDRWTTKLSNTLKCPKKISRKPRFAQNLPNNLFQEYGLALRFQHHFPVRSAWTPLSITSRPWDWIQMKLFLKTGIR